MADGSKTYGEGSIFSAFLDVQASLQRNADIYPEKERQEIVTEITRYFNEARWAKDSIDRALWGYAQKGIKGKEASSLLHISANTYRTRLQRVSAKLRTIMFDDHNLADVCLNDDINVVKSYVKRINFLNTSFEYYKEFSQDFIRAVDEKCREVKPEDTFETQDVLNAVCFMLFNSERIKQNSLNRVNTAALNHVVTCLTTPEYNDIFSYYKSLGSYVMRSMSVPAQVGEAVLNTCAKEKG
jgi:hypothetical protein